MTLNTKKIETEYMEREEQLERCENKGRKARL